MQNTAAKQASSSADWETKAKARATVHKSGRIEFNTPTVPLPGTSLPCLLNVWRKLLRYWVNKTDNMFAIRTAKHWVAFNRTAIAKSRSGPSVLNREKGKLKHTRLFGQVLQKTFVWYFITTSNRRDSYFTGLHLKQGTPSQPHCPLCH